MARARWFTTTVLQTKNALLLSLNLIAFLLLGRLRIPSRAFLIHKNRYRLRKHEAVLEPAGLTPWSECPRCVHRVDCAGADPPVPCFLRECISAEVPIYRDFRCFCGSRWQNALDLYNGCFCDMIGFIKMQYIRR